MQRVLRLLRPWGWMTPDDVSMLHARPLRDGGGAAWTGCSGLGVG